MTDRWQIVDRVAEALFVRYLSNNETDFQANPFFQQTASQCYDAANAFYDEHVERRGEWEAKQAAEDPMATENHAYEPPPGGADACLVCAKRKDRHHDRHHDWKPSYP